jgi:hypothetical protein
MDDRKALGERRVGAVREGEEASARLVWWERRTGGDYRYGVTLEGPFGTVSGEASDLFEALSDVRRQLEPSGWAVAVQGARRDTFPSPMLRDMARGERVYVLRPGIPATPDDIVGTFDDAPAELLASVDEQRRHIDEME